MEDVEEGTGGAKSPSTTLQTDTAPESADDDEKGSLLSAGEEDNEGKDTTDELKRVAGSGKKLIVSRFWEFLGGGTDSKEITGVPLYWRIVKDNRGFRYLWMGQAISFFGDFFNFIATIAILHQFSESKLAITGLMISRLLPPVILTPLIGAIADTYDRGKVLLVCDGLRFIAALGFLLVRTEDQLWMLYFFSAIQSALGGLFGASKLAMLPSLVPESQIVGANALDITTWSISCALGASAGGAFTGTAGTDASFLVDAISYLFSAIFIVLMIKSRGTTSVAAADPSTNGDASSVSLGTTPGEYHKLNVNDEGNTKLELELESEQKESEEKERCDPLVQRDDGDALETITLDTDNNNKDTIVKSLEEKKKEKASEARKEESFLVMMKEGFMYLFKHKDTFLICHHKSSMSYIWGAVDVIAIEFSENEFDIAHDGGSLALGLLFAAIGLGCLLGPLVALKYSDEKSPTSLRYWLSVGTFVPLVLGTWLGAWSPNVWFFMVGLGGIRPFGEAIGYVFSGSILQLSVPDYYRGRVFAYEGGVKVLTESMGSFTAGFLLDEGFSAHVTCAIISTIATVIGLFWTTYYLIYKAYHLKKQREQEKDKLQELELKEWKADEPATA